MDDYAAQLESQVQSVSPQDTMAEAGRKVLLADFIKMLKHEAGARTGDDLEDVHDMRVATRRMRSALRLFESYFKPKWIDAYSRRLRKIARALGVVRDLDVLIQSVEQYGALLELPKRASHKKLSDEEKAERDAAKTLADEQQTALATALESLKTRRDEARADLIDVLDSKSYRRFAQEFGEFLTTAGQGVAKDAGYPVGLVLPNVIYEQLMAVRIHDHEVEAHTPETLHALRVEFKRLRYTVSFFDAVLGKEIDEFIDELKKIQDHLGRLNDVVVAQAALSDTLSETNETPAALQVYLEKLAAEQAELQEGFVEVWKRFNTKSVQKKLALAIAGID
jgi:CHAD domain-containing protein